nr:hypothetical protein Ade03nite_83180 [Actinoplanes derwentensis]
MHKYGEADNRDKGDGSPKHCWDLSLKWGLITSGVGWRYDLGLMGANPFRYRIDASTHFSANGCRLHFPSAAGEYRSHTSRTRDTGKGWCEMSRGNIPGRIILVTHTRQRFAPRPSPLRGETAS